MVTEKTSSLVTLIESANQTHLTIYLQNRSDLADLKKQIKDSLCDARKSLDHVLSDQEVIAFLAPVETLLTDARVIAQLKGNIGIFRTKSTFRVLSIPVEVSYGCHVATTFHVKPLLRWMQWDTEFLLVGLSTDSAQLYLGSQDKLRKVDSILYPKQMTELLNIRDSLTRAQSKELKQLCHHTFSWMSDWIENALPKPQLKLFVAGDHYLVHAFNHGSSYSLSIHKPVVPYFREEKAVEIAHKVRSILKIQAKKRLDLAILTFQVADEMKLSKSNIRDIALAAARGRVKKLIIAENREVFGKLNFKTGALAIHPFDLDHEDDDLLDDLAQQVLLSGGEVYLAKKEDIPAGRSILAIVDSEYQPATQTHNDHSQTQKKKEPSHVNA